MVYIEEDGGTGQGEESSLKARPGFLCSLGQLVQT